MSDKNIEAIYPLSPMQEGMLFHTLYDPQSGLYFEQFTCVFEGQLDVAAFKQAWQRVVEKHAALRTAFVWEKQDKPLQVVFRQVILPWQEMDWRAVSPSELASRFEAFMAADRKRGFELNRPPLMRLALIRLAENVFRFVWSHHHLLLDGWSLPIVLQDALNFYESLRQGQECAARPGRPYKDYIGWLQKQSMAQAETFWRKTLAGFTTPTPVVESIGKHSGAAAGEYAEFKWALSTEMTGRLQALARQHQLTLNTLIQGAWALLLAYYSGAADVVFGQVVAGRPPDLPDVETMVGLFINTLPVRAQLAPHESLVTWLKSLQRQQLEMRQYEYSPLARIQEWSEIGPGAQLFESLIAFENYPVDAALRDAAASLGIRDIHASERTNYPLSAVFHVSDALNVRFIYEARYFEPATIRALAERFEIILANCLARPEAPLGELDWLSPQERQRILCDWNATEGDYARDTCVHTWVEEQARRRPDAPAVIQGDRQLTYAQLDACAEQLARWLQRQGVKAGAHVALGLERSLELVVAALGVLKAGGAYVPLDPAYPKERLAFMLRDCHASALLTSEQCLPALPSSSAPVICLQVDGGALTLRDAEGNLLNHNQDMPPVAADVFADNLAYVIYTSGSTGQPKGVQIRHSGLMNLIAWYHQTFQITPLDRMTLMASPAFDASVFEMWPCLTAGASLYIPDDKTRDSLPELIGWLAANQITVCFLATPLAEAAMVETWPQDVALRCMLTGGDKLHHSLPAPLPFQLVNLYGPTEDTVCTTGAPVPVGYEAPSIGRPILNKQVYVLDGNMQPVGVGVPGELYIGGAGLAMGYLDRPDLTAERFVPNPFADRQPAGDNRLYRTGDRVRYRADGSLEFLGRTDRQVKIRGYRIELGEIEAALGEHPRVRAAIVMLQEGRAGHRQLVAYFVPASKGPLTLRELTGFLKQRLPDYMIPSAFIALEAFPLTPNGKIDLKALPQPERAQTSNFVAPRTPLEETLAAVWKQVLGVERVGVRDNFFELGGDSILSIQMVARAAQAGLRLSVKQIFEHPTIEELAQVASAATALAEQGPVTGVVPLTPIQHWFFAQQFPNPHHFNQAIIVEAHEPLEPDLLRQALAHVLNHHDALRARYVRTAEGWQQKIVEPSDDVPFFRVDLSETPMEQLADMIEARSAEAQASLNVSDGPLVKMLLFECGQGRPARLVWIIHHLAVDNVSWRILLEDLQAAYIQLKQGGQARLPAKTSSFKHWAERLVEYAQTEAVGAELPYWLEVLRPPLASLPMDEPSGRRSNTAAGARVFSTVLDAASTELVLRQALQAYRAEINAVLLAALAQTLAQWIGDRPILVSLEGHGRHELFEDVDLSRTVGWFTTTFPLRLDLRSNVDFVETLKAVKERLRQVPHHGFHYGVLRYLRRDTLAEQLQAPQPEISLNYLGQLDQNFRTSYLFAPGRESTGPASAPDGERSHLIDIVGWVLGDQMHFDWVYNANVHYPQTVQRLAETFIDNLKVAARHSQTAGAQGYTPSDFPAARMEQDELDKFMSALG